MGALARFMVGGWLAGPAGSFPWPTLAVNVAGSALLGFLMAAFPAWHTPTELRLLLTVGFCGSFTTFSTFGYEAVMLVQGGAPGLAAAYVGSSIVLGIVAVFLGLALGGTLA